MKPMLVLGHFNPEGREPEMTLRLREAICLTRGGFRQASGPPSKFQLPAHFQLMRI